MKLLPALLLAFLPALPGAAEEKPVKGIDIALVAENSSVARGVPFTVGVKIHHHEGFHTYWRNPGIAGVPVKLEWQLPAGFSAGPIQWPYPQKSMMAIHPVHGFERDVMLLVEVTPPAELPARVKLKATASWMACADGCYPGKKELVLELPVEAEAKADPAVAASFTSARAELPRPIEGWKAELLSAPDAAEIRVRLTPADDRALPPGDIYFFSSDGQISSDPPQRVEKTPDGTGFEIIAARSPYGPKGKSTLPGVLVSSRPLSKGGPSFASIEPRSADGATAAPAASTKAVPGAVKKCDCEP